MILKGSKYVRVNTENIDSAKKICKGMKIPFKVVKKPEHTSMLLNKKVFTITKHFYIKQEYEAKFRNC